MDKKIAWRIVVIVAVVGLCLWSLYPARRKDSLGLDLSGGIHLVLQVQTDDAIKAELDDASQRLVSRANERGHRARAEWRRISTDLSFTVSVPAEPTRRPCVRSRRLLDSRVRPSSPEQAVLDVSAAARTWTARFATWRSGHLSRPSGIGSTSSVSPNRSFSARVWRATASSSSCRALMIPARVKDRSSSTPRFSSSRRSSPVRLPDRQSLFRDRRQRTPGRRDSAPATARISTAQVIGTRLLSPQEGRPSSPDRSCARHGAARVSSASRSSTSHPAAARPDKFGEYTGSHIGDPAGDRSRRAR